MASIRSASIGPFGSLTVSGQIQKLPISKFQSSFASKLRLPFLAALVHGELDTENPEFPVSLQIEDLTVKVIRPDRETAVRYGLESITFRN